MQQTNLNHSCLDCLPRRGFLTRLLATGAASVLSSCAVPPTKNASPLEAKRDLVDVHHHVWAPAFLKELESRKLAEPPARNWSLNKTLDDMALAGVTYSITSPTTPAASFGDAETMRRMARVSNEYGAQLAREQGHGRGRHRTEQDHVHPDAGEAGDHGVFQHVARQAGVLADHHPVAVIAAQTPGDCFHVFLEAVRIATTHMCPVIMLTDLALQSRVTEAVRVGVHEFLVKPISPKTLQQRLLGIILNPRPMVRAGKFYIPKLRKVGDIFLFEN